MPPIDPNRKVRVALDKEGNLIYAGDPDREDEDSIKELLNLIEQRIQRKDYCLFRLFKIKLEVKYGTKFKNRMV